MMTIIAVLSGLLAAIVILAVLVSLIGCRKAREADVQSDSDSSLRATPTRTMTDDVSKHSSILTIYQPSRDSLYKPSAAHTVDCSHCHCNAAFVGSELNLQASVRGNKKPKKKAHWQDEIVLTADDKSAVVRALPMRDTAAAAAVETKLDMERY